MSGERWVLVRKKRDRRPEWVWSVFCAPGIADTYPLLWILTRKVENEGEEEDEL